MSFFTKLENAFRAFDQYNAGDPNIETVDGVKIPKELLYARRMTERLDRYASNPTEALRLAARCQHIGRWEVPRQSYPMDRRGYLKWRSDLAIRHASIAEGILQRCGYSPEVIRKVKSLLRKKGLANGDADTQLLEDVICLVFIEHYLDDFAAAHDDDKVVDILKKTIAKMSPRALSEVANISISERVNRLIKSALS